MEIKDYYEDDILEIIKKKIDSYYIGDDTAFIKDKNLNFTCDSMAEGVHFLKDMPPSFLGWKAMSANVSDIVSNGGKPLYALISLFLPKETKLKWIEELYDGINESSKFYGFKVIGGNLSSFDKKVIDIFMAGEVSSFKGREGAKPKEKVFVSGTLGDSKAGLILLLENKKDLKPYEKALIERHLRPTARIDYLSHISKYASSSMDISDGLSADIFRLAKRSRVVIRINKKSIPISKELRTFCEERGLDPYEFAIEGGEDYQLLFTHKESYYNPFLDMSMIGEVLEFGSPKVFLDEDELERKSFDHFKKL